MPRQPLTDEQRQAMITRLATARAVLRAHENFAAIDAAVAACSTKAEAMERLQEEPFHFSQAETEHLLDLPLSTRTEGWRARVREEIEELRGTLAGDP
jgi:hypothetical protein